FGARWIEKLPPGESIPCFHHGEEREIPVHRRFFEEMSRIEVDRDPPKVPVTVVMGRQDASVPFDLVADVWSGWERSGRLVPRSRFVETPAGDHGLVAHVGEIASEIERICGP